MPGLSSLLSHREPIAKLRAIGRTFATIEFSLDGRIITANDKFLAMMGYALAELRGSHHSIFLDPGAVNLVEYQAFWQALRGGDVKSGEFRRLARGGREVWLEASYNPVLNLAGRPVKVMMVAVDSTDRHFHAEQSVRYERALERSNLELERRARQVGQETAARASRARSRLLADMSHELRTPLNGMLGYTRLLHMEGGLSAQQEARVASMLDAGDRLFKIINSVLDHSAIEGEAAEDRQAAPAEQDDAGSMPAADLHGLRVLVVDDVDMNRDIAAAFLRAAAHEVVCVDSGAAAIAAVADAAFDVVLMDVRMPDIDGLEATRRIREAEAAGRRLPIIALTAQVFSEQVAACVAAGMDGHLAKPFTRESLAAAIAQAAGGPPDRAPAPPLPTPAEPEHPVRDPAVFAQTADLLAPEMVVTHLRTVTVRCEALLHDLETAPAPASKLAAQAHALAGCATLFGFARLAVAARQFERAVLAGSPDEAAMGAGLAAALEATLADIPDTLADVAVA